MAEKAIQEIGLVSCVSEKRDEAAEPRELYTSIYFEKMRAYAEQEHDGWWIISAEHGLLNPAGDPIEPYDTTLSDANRSDRREWAQAVIDQMGTAGLFDEPTRFVVHAGKDYYGELVPRLEEIEDVSVDIPTEGLRIGEKLAWYDEKVE